MMRPGSDPIRRAGDRLTERGLTDTRRSDQAENRPFQLTHALLHGQVLKDALLDLLQAMVIGVEHPLCFAQVFAHTRTCLPRHA